MQILQYRMTLLSARTSVIIITAEESFCQRFYELVIRLTANWADSAEGTCKLTVNGADTAS